MTSKDRFLKDSELCKFWTGVVHDPRYDQFEMALQSDICRFMNIDEINGAMKILDLMRTIAENPEPQMKTPSAGIEHKFSKSDFKR